MPPPPIPNLAETLALPKGSAILRIRQVIYSTKGKATVYVRWLLSLRAPYIIHPSLPLASITKLSGSRLSPRNIAPVKLYNRPRPNLHCGQTLRLAANLHCGDSKFVYPAKNRG